MNEQITLRVKAVSTKAAGNGTKYEIEDDHGDKYSTFDDEVGKVILGFSSGDAVNVDFYRKEGKAQPGRRAPVFKNIVSVMKAVKDNGPQTLPAPDPQTPGPVTPTPPPASTSEQALYDSCFQQALDFWTSLIKREVIEWSEAAIEATANAFYTTRSTRGGNIKE